MKHTSMTLICAGLLAAASSTMAAETKAATETKSTAEPQVTLSAGVDYVTVKGDENKYRSDHWVNDGWRGGIEDLTWHRMLGKDWTLDLGGHAIFGNQDYKLDLQLAKPDLGFLHIGASEYRKYYSNTGGYYPYTTGTKSYDLPFDPIMDIGNFTVDIGLTLPNLPKVVLGYERQYKEGTKSLIQWGSAYGATNGVYGVQRKLAPAYKDVDETVDIFKLSLEHEIKGILIGDEFRYEQWKLDAYRVNVVRIDATNNPAVPTQTQWTRTSDDQNAVYNAFHMEQQLTKNLYWSLGYMYRWMDGDASSKMDQPGVTSSQRRYYSNDIDLGQDQHVVGANLFYTFGKNLSLYGGLQYENDQTERFMDGSLKRGSTENPRLVQNDEELESLEGNLGMRYTGIKYTTIYVEGRAERQWIDKKDRDLLGASIETIDTDVDRYSFTAGVACAPVRKVSFNTQYRYSVTDNASDALEDGSFVNTVIRDQKFTTHQFSAKLTLRPVSKVSATLGYKLVATDIDSRFGDIEGGPDVVSNESGEIFRSIYSLSVTVTPIDRLFVTGTFSYDDTYTDTYRNPASATDNPSRFGLQYRGDVWSATGTAGFAIDEKTMLTASYSYTKSDNFVNNYAVGMPYGTDWQQHEVGVSLSRQLRDNISVQVRYGYSEYQDDANGGYDNYRAHQFGTTCKVRF